MNAIEQVKAKVPNGQDLKLSVLNHGTTVATNSILEGKGARVALLVTEGYKDVLQVKRSNIVCPLCIPLLLSVLIAIYEAWRFGWLDRMAQTRASR